MEHVVDFEVVWEILYCGLPYNFLNCVRPDPAWQQLVRPIWILKLDILCACSPAPHLPLCTTHIVVSGQHNAFACLAPWQGILLLS